MFDHGERCAGMDLSNSCAILAKRLFPYIQNMSKIAQFQRFTHNPRRCLKIVNGAVWRVNHVKPCDGMDLSTSCAILAAWLVPYTRNMSKIAQVQRFHHNPCPLATIVQGVVG